MQLFARTALYSLHQREGHPKLFGHLPLCVGATITEATAQQQHRAFTLSQASKNLLDA
jgi:hypothetical protein